MLTRDQVRAAIRFQNPPRPPRAYTKWWGEGLWEQYGEKLHQFNCYEEDVVIVWFPCPSFTPRDDGFYWRLPDIDRSRFTAIPSSMPPPRTSAVRCVSCGIPLILPLAVSFTHRETAS